MICKTELKYAIEKGYPLMGFSQWHIVVGSHVRYENVACNAVICIKCCNGTENVVIKGNPFSGTNYFHPHTIAFERSKRFPNGKYIKINPYTIPSEIGTQIWLELYK